MLATQLTDPPILPAVQAGTRESVGIGAFMFRMRQIMIEWYTCNTACSQNRLRVTNMPAVGRICAAP
jgi:hypothetical protein